MENDWLRAYLTYVITQFSQIISVRMIMKTGRKNDGIRGVSGRRKLIIQDTRPIWTGYGLLARANVIAVVLHAEHFFIVVIHNDAWASLLNVQDQSL